MSYNLVARGDYETRAVLSIAIPRATFKLIHYSIYHIILFYRYICIHRRIDGPDREAVDFLPGSQYILRYQPISSLVKSGAARLI